MASIGRHKSGGWIVRWYGGRDSAGKRTRFSKVLQTREDAVAYARRIAPTEGRGTGKDRIGAAMLAWVETRATMDRISVTTAERERQLARAWGRLLGDMPVHKVTAADVQAALTTLAREGRSGRTLAHHRQKLSQFFRHLVRADVVARSPVEAAIVPPVAKPKAIAPSPAQAAELQRLADEATATYGQLGMIVRVALHTGMRRGEVLGLTWSAVDFDRATIRVEASLVQVRGRPVLKEPKTAMSRRTIPIGTALVEALREHRKAQAQVRLRAGSMWAGADLLFCNSIGEPLSPTDVSRRLRELTRRIEGWPNHAAPLHGLRHAHGSRLNAAGVDVTTIQRRLGHSTPTTTLTLYVHGDEDLDRAAVAALDDLG